MSAEPDIEELYGAIGFVVSSWAFIEQSLDMCITTVVHIEHYKADDKSHPRTVARKVRFMRKALNLSRYKRFRRSGTAILDRIANTKDDRNDLVHSVVSDVVLPKTFRLASLKIDDVDGWQLIPGKVLLDLIDFPAQQQKLEVLAMDALQFSSQFVRAHAATP